MKKRIIAVIVSLCLVSLLFPVISRAAVMPYFIAVNDTLLPFDEDTMPFILGNDIYVNVTVFESLNMYSIISRDMERVLLYRGVETYLDFYPVRRVTVDMDGNALPWPSARRDQDRIYVPLRQVCEYFGLSFTYVEVPRGIIDSEQVMLVRIITSSYINDPTFMSINERAMRNAYNSYFAPPPPPSPGEPLPPPDILPPPTYNDVTIYISFYNISDESTYAIMDFFDVQAASGYYSAFFVSAADIGQEPGLIRRIAGTGHTIGIWLTEGTFDEYLEASAWLFEAAKVKTLLISASNASQIAAQTAAAHGLIYWEGPFEAVQSEELTLDDIIPMFPTDSGLAANILFPCSRDVAIVLPGVYSFLRSNEYTLERITETTQPVFAELIADG